MNNDVIYPTMVIRSQAETIELQEKEIDRLNNEIKILLQENNSKEKVIIKQENIIKIMEKYFELIIDLGYDYDGLNQEESLKKLIDELCKYASLGRAYNITEPIYVNENKKYNILHEELKGSGNNE